MQGGRREHRVEGTKARSTSSVILQRITTGNEEEIKQIFIELNAKILSYYYIYVRQKVGKNFCLAANKPTFQGQV